MSDKTARAYVVKATRERERETRGGAKARNPSSAAGRAEISTPTAPGRVRVARTQVESITGCPCTDSDPPGTVDLAEGRVQAWSPVARRSNVVVAPLRRRVGAARVDRQETYTVNLDSSHGL